MEQQREVYGWRTQDKRAANLIGRPCYLISAEALHALLDAASSVVAADDIHELTDAHIDRLRSAITRATPRMAALSRTGATEAASEARIASGEGQ